MNLIMLRKKGIVKYLTMEASDILIEKVKEFEGLRLTSYKDSAEVWTIGYGHTRGVKAGQSITEKQADSLLRGDLLTAENYVNGLKLNLTQGQFDALVDFCYNLGAGNLAGSTLLAKIRAKAPTEEIQAQFKRWVYSKGKKLGGLVKRREWEARRWTE